MKEYAYRLLSRLRSTENFDGTDAVYITDPCNMRYLSGFSGGEGALFISDGQCVLITDSRYAEAAERESDFDVIRESRTHRRSEILSELRAQHHVRTIGYEDRHLTCSAYRDLTEKIGGGLRWLPVGDAADRLRRIKRPDEIELLAEAERIGDLAFGDLIGRLQTGMTELEAAAELEYLLKKHGAEGLSFETIAASGPNSSMPHAVPTGRKLQPGDFLTLDFGCRFHGYCSDMTRTVAFGAVSDDQRKLYETVLRAQTHALGGIHAGMTGEEADALARGVISDAGYGAYFGHALGHSVGLYIHEDPRLGPGAEDVLEAGMAVTVEPGIYVPGFCGVRIEDLVIVTEDGCRNLSGSTKELLILQAG